MQKKETSFCFQSKLLELKVKLWGKLDSLCHNNGLERRKEVATGWGLPGLGWDRDKGLDAKWSWEKTQAWWERSSHHEQGPDSRQFQGSQAIFYSCLHSYPHALYQEILFDLQHVSKISLLRTSTTLFPATSISNLLSISLWAAMLLSLLPSIYFQHSCWSCIQCKSDHVTPLLRFSNDPISSIIKAAP